MRITEIIILMVQTAITIHCKDYEPALPEERQECMIRRNEHTPMKRQGFLIKKGCVLLSGVGFFDLPKRRAITPKGWHDSRSESSRARSYPRRGGMILDHDFKMSSEVV